MEWTHLLVWLLGIFVGSFLMTVRQNQRNRRQAERNLQFYAAVRKRSDSRE